MIIKDTFKPIPKYMLKIIKDTDLKNHKEQNGVTRFYSYLTKFKKQLVRVTVAVRNYRNKWLCKQVVLHGIHSSKCYLKDIVSFHCSGYQVGWYAEGVNRTKKWYEYDGWDWNDDKYFNIFCPIVNKEFISKFPEYKYSAVELYQGNDIFNYLRLYEKYPQVEYLTKAGLQSLATSKRILNRCSKDKEFCKWIFKHKNELKSSLYINSIISAYKQNKDVEEVDKFEKFKKEFADKYSFRELKQMLKEDEKIKFLQYLIKQKTNGYSYNDYLKACQYLNIDMNEEKNRYPHDFKRWHDIRIDEYHSAQLKKDKKQRKEFYKQFSNVANKYLSLQRILEDTYCVIIAKSPADLIKEGFTLNHCVGRMGYDQKFVREESLIFFIRNKETPDIPFVTVEYSLRNKKVLQCYGKDDHRPNDNVLDFVNKVWLPYANKQIKKVA